MYRVTVAMMDQAFLRLHKAMGWQGGPVWVDGKARVGAVTLASVGSGCYAIHIIQNEGGGVHAPFRTWTTKREAFEAMNDMAGAVQFYKQNR